MREIRTLRAMWWALETEPRQLLTGHEEGNLGYTPRRNLRATAPVLDPTIRLSIEVGMYFHFHLTHSSSGSIRGGRPPQRSSLTPSCP